MRLIVLDTNVIASAGINPVGPPSKIVEDMVLSGIIQTVISPKIAAGYREVVRRPRFHNHGFPPLWLEYLIEESMQLPTRNHGRTNARPKGHSVPSLGARRRGVACDRKPKAFSESNFATA